MGDGTRLGSFETLAEFVALMADGLEKDRLLDELSGRLTTGLDASGACVALARTTHLRLASVHPGEAHPVAEAQLDSRGSPAVEAFATRAAVAVNDVQASRVRWPEYAARAADLGWGAVLSVPLAVASQPSGAVTIVSAVVREWSEGDVALAQAMTDLVAASLASFETVRRERQLAEQLQRALDGRVRIEQAKGILAESAGISVTEAFERIRRHARSHNVTAGHVAEAVITLGLRPGS